MTSSEPRGAAIATPTLGTKPAEGAEPSTLSTDDNDPLSSLRRELGLQPNDGTNLQVNWFIFEIESGYKLFQLFRPCVIVERSWVNRFTCNSRVFVTITCKN
jgi:hypothetical protein